MERLSDCLCELSIAIGAWCYLEAIRLVVEVDIHDCRSCDTRYRREHGLPVRKLATAEIAVLLAPAAHDHSYT